MAPVHENAGIRNSIQGWIFELDRLLRGETTCRRELFRDSPKNADIRFPVGGMSVVLGALGATYGICMGVFALARGAESSEYAQACMQVFASMTKVPLLFALTIAVTFPSLYVFNALMGSQLKIGSVFRLLIASLAVNLSALASLGPIVAFFSLSSPNYSFIVLLNVLMFATAGVLGLGFLIQTLRGLNANDELSIIELTNKDIVEKSERSLLEPAESKSIPSVRANPAPVTNRRNVDWVFSCWMVAFGLVGAQMGWILRPFIGCPGRPFEMFRERHSNFFAAVWNSMVNVIT